MSYPGSKSATALQCGDDNHGCGGGSKGHNMQPCKAIPITPEDIGRDGFVIDRSNRTYSLAHDTTFDPRDHGAAAIRIRESVQNITIDLCQHHLRQKRRVNGVRRDVIGVYVEPFADGITIRNGSITDFSALGVWVEYGSRNIVGEKLQLLRSGYAGASPYPVLDGFNLSTVVWAAGGWAWGGVLAGDTWFNLPEDQLITNAKLVDIFSADHLSTDSPIARMRNGVTLSLPKTIAGVGGANTDALVLQDIFVSNIREDSVVNLGSQGPPIVTPSGGGTARGITIANGLGTVGTRLVGEKIACALGLTVLNFVPARDTTISDSVARDIELTEDVLAPSRGVVGFGGGGPLPNYNPNPSPELLDSPIITQGVSFIRCVAQNVRVGPAVDGRGLSTDADPNAAITAFNVPAPGSAGNPVGGVPASATGFPGGFPAGFVTGFNLRGALQAVCDQCQAIDIVGTGDMVISGYHTTSDNVIRNSTALHVRGGTGEAGPDPSNTFHVNGVGFLVGPPPRNNPGGATYVTPPGLATQFDPLRISQGNATWRDNSAQDCTIGYRVLPILPPAPVPPATVTPNVLLYANTFVATQPGDQPFLYNNAAAVEEDLNNWQI